MKGNSRLLAVAGATAGSLRSSESHRGSGKLSLSSFRKRAPAALTLLLTFPFDAFIWPTASTRIIPFVRLTRYAYAIIRGHQSLLMLERSQAVPFSLCRLTRVMVFFTVSTHALACAFVYFCTRPGAVHYASAPWHAADTTASRYLRSTYWSLMTFTTTGHVDIVNEDVGDPEGVDWEVGAALVVAFMATFVYIYINANFTTMMIRLNSRLEQYRTQLAGVDAYLKRNKVSKDVSKRVKRHFARANRADTGGDKALLDSLPPSLSREVLQDIHMRTLRRAATFFGLEAAALAQVCAVVHTVTFLPEEVVCQQGDVMTEMYLLEEGCILSSAAGLSSTVKAEDPGPSVTPENSRNNKLLKSRGTPMCELAFLFGVRQEATLEAISTTKCSVLHKSDFMHLMKDFPDILDLAQRSVVALMRESNDPMLAEVERMQIKTEKQIAGIFDMLFAAASGRLEVVQEAITHGGVNASEVDYEGRSALHAAATAGHLNIVQCLLQAKVNVNRKDNFGKTPLANAIAKNHREVVVALRDAGGELGWNASETAAELCDRAHEAQMQQLTLILSCGAQVDAADYDKWRTQHLNLLVLMRWCASDRVPSLRVSPHAHRRTSLHVASSEGNL
eukprot:3181959-Prymnesium_polylepis.1